MALTDRTVLVTGGTGHLGQAVVSRFLKDNQVVTTYIDDEEWDALERDADSDALSGYKTDVTAPDQVDALVDKVISEHGRIDAVLHLVGGWAGGDRIEMVDASTWHGMVELNLTSCFLMTQAVLPHMREQGFGRIACIGSKTGHELPAEGGPYAVAKHGLESLTEIVAKETADTDITMNCVMPSVIDTPVTRDTLGAETASKGVTPAEVADAIMGAVSGDESGASIPVYGELG